MKAKMKKFIPLGTALLSALTLISLFFSYTNKTQNLLITEQTKSLSILGDDGILAKLKDYPDFVKTSTTFYVIALILAAIIIALAVLNFLGIGGKNVGYIFIGISVLAFVAALIATIALFGTEKNILGVETAKYVPALAPWWASITSLLAMLSTGNVLVGKKK
jgi:hypothetical protein